MWSLRIPPSLPHRQGQIPASTAHSLSLPRRGRYRRWWRWRCRRLPCLHRWRPLCASLEVRSWVSACAPARQSLGCPAEECRRCHHLRKPRIAPVIHLLLGFRNSLTSRPFSHFRFRPLRGSYSWWRLLTPVRRDCRRAPAHGRHLPCLPVSRAASAVVDQQLWLWCAVLCLRVQTYRVQVEPAARA